MAFPLEKEVERPQISEVIEKLLEDNRAMDALESFALTVLDGVGGRYQAEANETLVVTLRRLLHIAEDRLVEERE